LGLPRQRLDGAADRLPRALIANAQLHHSDYSRIAGRLIPLTLMNRIRRDQERVISLAGRANQCMRVERERRRERFLTASVRLAASLRANAEAQRVRVARARERIGVLQSRAERAVLSLIDLRYARLDRAAQLLTALSYHGVLARGFALVRGTTGRPLRAAAAINPGVRLDIEFADGRVRATAEARALAGPPSAQPVRRKTRRSNPGQGSLF